MTIIERIARVLAGMIYSERRIAAGEHPAPADLVDQHWRDHVDDAIAVLKTLREPDDAMVEAGRSALKVDPAVGPVSASAVYTAMIEAAIVE